MTLPKVTQARLSGFWKAGHLPTLFTAFLYFDLTFAVWVLNGALAPFISEEFHLSAGQKGLMLSVPVLAGALMRFPLGVLSQYIGRKRAAIVEMSLIIVGLAVGWQLTDSYAGVIAMGIPLGVAGAAFGVALSLGAGWYPPEYKGLAMGIAGAGNSGAVLAVLFAPPLAAHYGWRAVYGLAILPIVVAMVLLALLAKEPPDRERKSLRAYLAVLIDRDAWILTVLYMVTFGGYIGLTTFLPTLFHDQYLIPKEAVGAYAAIAIVSASVLRVAGGWLSDRIGGIRLLEVLMIVIMADVLVAATLPASPALMVAVLVIGFAAMGAGNGAVFQLVPLRFRGQAAVAGSLVGEIGALAGGFLPNALGLGKSWTGSYGPGLASIAVIALGALALLALAARRWTTTWVGEGGRAHAADTASPAPLPLPPPPVLEETAPALALEGEVGVMRALVVLSMLAAASRVAVADDVTASSAAPPPPPAPAAPAYALPFQLRPAAVADVVRSDTAIASYQGGATIASTLLAAARITPTLAPLVRVAVVHDAPPTGTPATSMSNLLVGLAWAAPLTAPWKATLTAAVTIPVGSGGGDTPDMARLAAVKAGVLARSGMDNALFAVDDVAAIGGADLAWVRGGFTAQAEVTLFQLTRARGGAVSPDMHKTNATAGVFVGWAPRPDLALGAELRYQRWLSIPASVAADMSGASRDTLTAAVGVRTKIDLGDGHVLKPGIAIAHGIDDPINKRGYDIVQIDLPLSF